MGKHARRDGIIRWESIRTERSKVSVTLETYLDEYALKEAIEQFCRKAYADSIIVRIEARSKTFGADIVPEDSEYDAG